ncbi:hypothetical protein [Sphingomicrobium clamense]|uniref:Terminase small subunit n=1 Tax=Sphingomicrobium clamense TaxID=2851013 RepID=A0ABS6V8Y6_9SPHN|nr:hypothetical protein [Sphingomicrobium sp. B8]MBW0145538.1 hypothetical protein [Sphingomicrobium sp. B8]
MTIYSKQLAERICQAIADGHSLAAIEKMEKMPCKRTIIRWRTEHAEFDAAYRDARTVDAINVEDQVRQLVETVNCKDSAAAAREKFQMLKWLAAVKSPREYGNRTEVSHETRMNLAEAISAARKRAGMTSQNISQRSSNE